MLSFFHIFRQLAGQLKAENLHRVILVIVVLILAGSAAFWFFEKDLGFGDAVWWSVVTVTTVGYGDISPATLGGRVVGVTMMTLGIGFLGILTATIAGVFVENKLMENRGMKTPRVDDHYVICGWNFRGPEIVAELRADEKSARAPIVVLADLEAKPADGPGIHFIRGEVNAVNLEKTGLEQAQAVVMLSRDGLEDSVRDAKVILDTLTVKSLYPKVYACVELMEARNVEHCHRAGADEVVVVGELATNLLVQAALDHGVTRMISELVSNRYGNDLFKVEPPAAWVGRKFIDLMTELKQERGILLLGVENRKDFELVTNPDAEYALAPDDLLLVISQTRPNLT